MHCPNRLHELQHLPLLKTFYNLKPLRFKWLVNIGEDDADSGDGIDDAVVFWSVHVSVDERCAYATTWS